MSFVDLVTLPYRLAASSTQVVFELAALVAPDGPVRRRGGLADQTARLIGDGGLAERLNVVLADPDGPAGLLELLADLTSAERPLGRTFAEGGTLDRLLEDEGPLERLTERGGALDRLLAEGGPLDRVIADDGLLDRLLAPGGVVDRLTRPDGLLERLLADDGILERVLVPGGLVDRLLTDHGFLEKVLADGGTLDQLVALGETLEHVHPRLAELSGLIPSLRESVDALTSTVGPLGELAQRLPGSRRRATLEL